MNQYYGAYPPQSLTPQQAAALGGWQNNQNLQQMQGVGIQNGYPQQFVQAIPGRMIHDIQEVRPNEVPNNGTVAIFPKDDMSCVYVKYLSNVGKIETMTFVPMAQTAENPPENGELAEIRDKLDEIVANRMADKDETIAQLRTQVSQMTLAASQQAQNNYLVNQLRPAPGPAYIVQNPYAGTGTLGCQIAGLTGCCNMAA